MVGCCKSFIREYFDQNPLSYLSVMVMRAGVACRLTELSGSPERQIAELSAHMETGRSRAGVAWCTYSPASFRRK
jgi:hypothetical protein